MSLSKTYVENFFTRNKFEIGTGRKTMDALRAQVNSLKKLLKSENRYKDADDIHIETLVMAREIQMLAAAEIFENGVLMFVDRRKKVKQKNHAVSTFYQMSRLISDVSEKLGLSEFDRHKIKLEKEEDDGFKD